MKFDWCTTVLASKYMLVSLDYLKTFKLGIFSSEMYQIEGSLFSLTQ